MSVQALQNQFVNRKYGQSLRIRSAVCALSGVTMVLGCSAAGAPPDNSADPLDESVPEVSSLRDGLAVGNSAPGFIGENGVSVADSPQCVVSEPVATFESGTVDIILVLDNSDSMANEIEEVENNINVNFGNILAASELDYRVILLSSHRTARREEETTSICVAAPLSGVEDCDSASAPIFTDQFFQYTVTPRGTNSLDILLDTFQPPFSDRGLEDFYGQAPNGWAEWIREGARKVVLIMSDTDDVMPTNAFLSQFTSLSPGDLGSEGAPLFAFHSIVGMRPKSDPTDAYLPTEPVMGDQCGPDTGPDQLVTDAGESFQELSRRTGGLRFPLCEANGYDVVFQAIADEVVAENAIACAFPVPDAPAGRVVDLETLQLDLLAPNQNLALGQVVSSEVCVPNAFYVDVDVDTVHLCPDTCLEARALPDAQLQVVLGCESSLLL